MTNGDNFTTKSTSYYKIRRFYHKIRQLLQNAMFITKCFGTQLYHSFQIIDVIIRNDDKMVETTFSEVSCRACYTKALSL